MVCALCSAIQLARMNGFSPIVATSSPKHTEYLKSLGATHVLDRSLLSDSINSALPSLTSGKPIHLVFDSWGREREAQRLGYSVLSPGGAFVHVNPFSPDWINDLIAENERKDEGRRIALTKPSYSAPGNKELGKEVSDRISGWLEAGVIVVRGGTALVLMSSDLQTS